MLRAHEYQRGGTVEVEAGRVKTRTLCYLHPGKEKQGQRTCFQCRCNERPVQDSV